MNASTLSNSYPRAPGPRGGAPPCGLAPGSRLSTPRRVAHEKEIQPPSVLDHIPTAWRRVARRAGGATSLCLPLLSLSPVYTVTAVRVDSHLGLEAVHLFLQGFHLQTRHHRYVFGSIAQGLRKGTSQKCEADLRLIDFFLSLDSRLERNKERESGITRHHRSVFGSRV